jgi:hypothetical protein
VVTNLNSIVKSKARLLPDKNLQNLGRKESHRREKPKRYFHVTKYQQKVKQYMYLAKKIAIMIVICFNAKEKKVVDISTSQKNLQSFSYSKKNGSFDICYLAKKLLAIMFIFLSAKKGVMAINTFARKTMEVGKKLTTSVIKSW